MKALFAAIILSSTFFIQLSFARDFNRNELAFINAVAACSSQFAQNLTENNSIIEGTYVQANDLDTWEMTMGIPSPGPMSPPRVRSILTITRSFAPTFCPPGLADCGGGRFTYHCVARTNSEGMEPGACSRDVNRYGQSSGCRCETNYSYDPRLGRCFSLPATRLANSVAPSTTPPAPCGVGQVFDSLLNQCIRPL